MSIEIEETERGFELTYGGRVRAVVDDLHVTAWGERQRLAAGGLIRQAVERSDGNDEVGPHWQTAFPFTTRSLRQPLQYRLLARCYDLEPTALLEIHPMVGQPVFGTEECAGLRIGTLPGCRRAVYIHQRVSEYGRDAVGCWWAQALFCSDPTVGNLWDWGLYCAWEADDGLCGAVVPMRAGGAVARLRGTENGLETVASGWCGKHVYPRLPLFVLSFGETPGEAIDHAMGAASRLGEWRFRLREEKVYPGPFEYLGYSTWGSLGKTLRERRCVDAARSFREHDIPVRWMMLDEGWQAVNEYHQLRGYDADGERFPEGLQATIRRLQGEGGLRHVGVWITLQGGWGGVDPGSSLARERPARFEVGTDGTTIPRPTPDGHGFWDDWLAHLRESGVDLVKVDNQGSGRNLYLGRRPIDDGVGGSIANLERAASASGTYLVASMSLHPECLHHYETTNVVRVSADLAPDDLTAAKLHLIHSVHVGAWVSRIAWPDYDGFPSTHIAARALAVMAALSGGPVYLCDRPGEHDPELAGRLCLRDGLLLQPEAPGEPPASRYFNDPLADDTPLVVQARAARVPRCGPPDDIADTWTSHTPATFVGVVNVGLDGHELTARIRLAELDLPPADTYAVTTHFGGVRQVLAPDDAVELTLAELEAELVTVAPIVDGRAILGLRDKLLGACGCIWDADHVISLPEPGAVLLYDELGRVPTTIQNELYTVYEGARELIAGEAWRDGAWLLVRARSTILRMAEAD